MSKQASQACTQICELAFAKKEKKTVNLLLGMLIPESILALYISGGVTRTPADITY